MTRITTYLDNITKRYNLGNATEHTFRGDLQHLIEALVPEIRATNEPKRQACGAPDYILTRKEIPVGFIEAKDIGDRDLAGAKKTGNKEQFDRYKASLNNLIFTDYLDFHLYINGLFIGNIAIAELQNGVIVPKPENFAPFVNFIKDFCSHISQTIKSPKSLAEMMAGKARLLSDVIGKALVSDETHNEDSTLKDQMHAFREILIHDITPKGFADVYAQTIAYGMFAARLHDATLPTFSRQEAAELIPKSNPFLRKLFGYIAGPDIDDRILWIVDSLVEIFLACNVAEILKNYGKTTKMEEPIIHFYETFLSEYDPALRKARGVWYTPAPVVNFIVRAVDEILKTEFDLPQGLADSSKTTIKTAQQGTKKIVEQEVHRVQILDPATGTGTFLAEVVKHVHKKFVGQQGIWSNYVESHLLPRLNGFELLMASYAMAHLQMDLLLTDTGYKPTRDQRLKIYLTNSLEEYHPDTGTLFASWLSTEANEANHIKRDTPVMCVMGNPPYAASSTNKNPWIDGLISDYKKDLNEQNMNSLSNDYVKFIRFGQYFVDKNGSGILAYISANSFIDGITYRQMRKNLLESFDTIYILDLHGDANKKEVSPDGSADQNVFDIMVGVSINIFIKTGKKKKNTLGEVFHFDLQGKRDFKYDFLIENSLKSLKWNRLEIKEPNYFFLKKDFDSSEIYEKGFSTSDLFISYGSGIKFRKDNILVKNNYTKENVLSMIYDMKTAEESVILKKYNITETNDWTIQEQRINFVDANEKDIQRVQYRPFDYKYTYYPLNKIASIIPRGDSRKTLMKHMLGKKNLALLCSRQNKSNTIDSFFITNTLSEMKTAERTIQSYHFPLYLYPDEKSLETERKPNLNMEIVEKIAEKLGLVFVAEHHSVLDTESKRETPNQVRGDEERGNDGEGTFAPIDILDYIYAVLHSPTYRETYKEFLKIDFPRVPYPKDVKTFWQLVKLGGELRQIHLLESPVVDNYITGYPMDGDNLVGKIRYDEGKVYINETQYFDNVPEVAWSFYIGGYQPAQKWLKDRRERMLGFEDIFHYQKIIVALSETDRIMKEIDTITI